MKRIYLSLIFIFALVINSTAINYEDARRNAWFLTDKMAYELDLTQEQFNSAYEINLDYFLNINSERDFHGNYWKYRMEDLKYILLYGQYQRFCAISYFYSPIKIISNRWDYPVYQYYNYDRYYYDRPKIYVSYRGGNWRQHIRGVSWYHKPSYTRYERISPNRKIVYRLPPTHHINIGGHKVVNNNRYSGSAFTFHFGDGNSVRYNDNVPSHNVINAGAHPSTKYGTNENKIRIGTSGYKNSVDAYRIGNKSRTNNKTTTNSRTSNNVTSHSNKGNHTNIGGNSRSTHKSSSENSVKKSRTSKKKTGVSGRPSRKKNI